MPNIFDYLSWRCDVPLSASPFNLVDNLILSELSYTDFSGIVPADGTRIPLSRACEQFFAAHDREEILRRTSYTARAPFLMESMLQGARFGTMELSSYVCYTDKDQTAQFAGVTCHLADKTVYVAFRGTDGTVVGWKEDFLLSYLSGTRGQQQAAEYLRQAAAMTKGPIRVGGHSKGGNFAVYASVFAGRPAAGRILRIYTNDGPGFREEVTQLPEYRALMEKTISIIPDTSVIGLLLTNACEQLVVKSSASGIAQHDGFSWEVERAGFVPASLSRTGELIDRALSSWVAGLDDETLESLVDSVFTLIESTGEDTFHSMSLQKLKTAEAMFSALRGLPREKQHVILQAIGQLLHSGSSAVTDTFAGRVLNQEQPAVENAD